jgi:hypothetical protein
MKNIHIFQTDKPTRLFTSDSELTLAGYPKTTFKTGKNIYITNDEKPKLNDWFLDTVDKVVFKVIYEDILTTQLDGLPSNFKKIILTTDQDLIKDGVQAIDDEFIEWFVKNPNCEEVEVKEVYFHGSGYYDKNALSKTQREIYSFMRRYKITIPRTAQQIINEDYSSGLEMGQILPKKEPKQEQKQHLIDLMKLDEVYDKPKKRNT